MEIILLWVAEVLININKAIPTAGSVFLAQADDAGTWSSDYLSVITGNISQLKFLLSEHTADAKTCVSASNMFRCHRRGGFYTSHLIWGSGGGK